MAEFIVFIDSIEDEIDPADEGDNISIKKVEIFTLTSLALIEPHKSGHIKFKKKEIKVMKKTMYVPFTSVSVDPEIQRMRDMLISGEDLVIDSDGTIGRASESVRDEMGGKAKTVPKAIVSVPEKGGTSVQELINEMRGEANEDDAAPEMDTMDSPKKGKTSVVPKGVLSTRSVSELIDKMRGEGEGANDDYDDEDDSYNESASDKPKIVPKTVVSAQWYESDPDLLMAEKAAMYDYKGNRAKFGVMRDGRAYWQVRCQPAIAGKDKRNCRAYDIVLVYDNDHPQTRYGSSVKAYLIRPTIADLQEIVNKTPGVSPKNIPHILRDSSGELYLCSADTSNVSTSLDSSRGITSAATSLRFALRWINIFELGLLDPVTWMKFQGHGQI